MSTTQAVLTAAREELSRLCRGGTWRMSIPGRSDYDSDLILGAAIAALTASIADGERLRALLRENDGRTFGLDPITGENVLPWTAEDKYDWEMLARTAVVSAQEAALGSSTDTLSPGLRRLVEER